MLGPPHSWRTGHQFKFWYSNPRRHCIFCLKKILKFGSVKPLRILSLRSSRIGYLTTSIWFLKHSSTVNGRIDQVNQVLELDKKTQGAARYTALDKWTRQLSTLHQTIINKMAWIICRWRFHRLSCIGEIQVKWLLHLFFLLWFLLTHLQKKCMDINYYNSGKYLQSLPFNIISIVNINVQL